MNLWNKGSSLGIKADSLSTCEYRQGSIWIIGARLGSNLYYAVRQWKNGETIVSEPKLVSPEVSGDVQIFISEKDGYVQLSCGGEFWWIDPKDIKEIQSVYPEDNPKPPWMPDMVCAVLGLHYNLKVYPPGDVKKFVEKLSLTGVDFIRIMGDWESTFEPGPGTSAFERAASGKFDLNKPNPFWDTELLLLKRILEPYHIKIYFDLIDRCDADKGPWENNEQGFVSIYDPMLLQRYIDFFDRAYEILGRDAKWGLGNEFFEDKTEWMRECVLPLAEHMYERVDKPICFSGDDMTGHHLHGLLSPDMSMKFGIRDSCLVRHGAATALQIRSFLESGSGDRCYGYSDDGVTMENYAPLSHGACLPAGVACQGTIDQRIAVIKGAWQWIEETNKRPKANEDRRFDHIEFMPREIFSGENPNTISQESLDVYWRLALAIWGIDIRRKMK